MILSRMAVERPVLTFVIVASILVLGIFSYTRLVVDLFPDIEFPFVTVTTVYPGAGPEEVESQVSKRIEDAVSSIAGIKRLDSINRESLSLVLIEFKLGVDQDQAGIDVREKIEAILNDLPDAAEKPSVVKFEFGSIPIMNIVLVGPQSLRDLFAVADNEVKDALSQAPGVASVSLVGSREREIRVALDPDRLAATGLDASRVAAAIASENVSVPAGHVTGTDREVNVRALGEFTDLDELRRLPITTSSGASVPLSSLGRILDTTKEARDFAEVDGAAAIGLSVQKRTDANTAETADAVRAAMAKIAPMLPEGSHLVVVRDSSTFIRQAVHDVLVNIAIGIILTTVLLYLFLHNIRTTVIAAVAMPTSIVATFLLIDFGGFTINVITLLGLGISIGVLVTNAIVVLESIARHLDELGEDPKTAARAGTDEVAIAVAATAMTNVVVFTPIAFMGGVIGMFFYQFGLTVVFATLFSLFVSFTLTPMLASKFLKSSADRASRADAHGRLLSRVEAPLLAVARLWERGYRRVEDAYAAALGWSMRHRIRTTLMVSAIFIVGLVLFRAVGGEFFPEGDDGYLQVNADLPAGTTIDQSREVMREAADIVRRNVPETESIMMTVGGEGMDVEDGQLTVRLIPIAQRSRTVFQIINALREPLAALPAGEINVQRFSEFGENKNIIVEVLGPDLDQITAIADSVYAIVASVPGLVDVELGAKPGKPEVVFLPDRDELSERGLAVGATGMELRNLYEGDVASVYREGGEEYDIRVRLDDRHRNRESSIRTVRFASPGGLVPIEAVGRLARRRSLAEITRKNRSRMVNVTANIGSGTLVEKVNTIRERADQLDLPPGYRIEYAGDIEMLGESFVEIYKALVLAILLTYLVLAAILESFVHPFTIMFTLPISLVGVSAALVLSGATINIMSLMAIVMLVGIVVNNAILILDLAAQLRKRGRDPKNAVLEASQLRFRAIVMTTLAIVVGILPQALGGSGAAYTVAMAVVTIGGVVAAGTLSLFIIPVVYTWFERDRKAPA